MSIQRNIFLERAGLLKIAEAAEELPPSTHGSHSVESKVIRNKEGYHKNNYVGMDTTIHKGTVQHKDNSKPTKFEVHNKPNGLHWQTNHSPEEKKAITAHLTKHKYFNARGFIGKDPARIHEEVEIDFFVEEMFSESSSDEMFASLRKARSATPKDATEAHKHLDKAEEHFKAGNKMRGLYHATKFMLAAKKYTNS